MWYVWNSFITGHFVSFLQQKKFPQVKMCKLCKIETFGVGGGRSGGRKTNCNCKLVSFQVFFLFCFVCYSFCSRTQEPSRGVCLWTLYFANPAEPLLGCQPLGNTRLSFKLYLNICWALRSDPFLVLFSTEAVSLTWTTYLTTGRSGAGTCGTVSKDLLDLSIKQTPCLKLFSCF